MQVNPRKVETKKTRNPNQLLNTRTTILKKIKITKDNLLQLNFEMFFENIFARKIVRKKDKIPEMKIVKRII